VNELETRNLHSICKTPVLAANMLSSSFHHVFKNVALLCLSMATLPATLAVILLISLYNRLSAKSWRTESPRQRKRILVTGVSMSKGLSIARLFHQKGHYVIGADVDRMACARVSRAIKKFYHLPQPVGSPESGHSHYVNSLVNIVKTEDIDLWVSVSGVSSALHDSAAKEAIEAKTDAKAIQFDLKQVKMFDAKDTFIKHAQELGLVVPETQIMNSQTELRSFLRRHGGLSLKPEAKQYLVKPIGVNDVARFAMPLLPFAGEEDTNSRIDALSFDGASSFIVQEFLQGQEYCTHALVINGRVRSFVACQSSDLLMHYVALPKDAPRSKSMLHFTKVIAHHGGPEFTGHLSFDFFVKSSTNSSGGSSDIFYPIECNPRAHTAVVLFRDTPELVDEYLSCLDPNPDEKDFAKVIYPKNVQRHYWVGQDFVEKLLCPVYDIIHHMTIGETQLLFNLIEFAEHALYWKDGTFETWDPWPFLWLYHVQWPLRFLRYSVKGKWNKLNVSTGKLFQAS
jgi:catechol O-methyltransferase